jgi:Arc/MetJ family transcription regulator
LGGPVRTGIAELLKCSSSSGSAVDTHTFNCHGLSMQQRKSTRPLTTIRVDTKLVDEAVRVLGVRSRTEAVRVALDSAIGPERFKRLMKEYRGKCSFAGFDE